MQEIIATLQIDFWRPVAGLMIFLLAMSFIENAIRSLAGHKVKQVIARNTERTIGGLLTGTVATAILQSSSLVGLLVLAFVGARIMSLKQALLTIFGANLGTTATGWAVALLGFKLDLDAISLPLIAIFGFCYTVLQDNKLRQIGQLGLGIGLLLLALQFMKSALGEGAVEPGTLAGFQLWQYTLFGIAASAVMQSSSAVMVLTLSALNSGVIDLHAGAALMIGADLGTTSTIIFGAINGTANKKRVALGHVTFNLVTDLIAFLALYPLVAIASLTGDPLLSLVAFHTLFNIVGVLLWAPLAKQFARALAHLFKDPATAINKFLDPSTLAVKELSAAALKNELLHLADRVIRQNATLFQEDFGSVPSKETYRISYRQTKQLEAEVLHYALSIQSNESAEFSSGTDKLLLSARNLLLSSKLCKDNLNDLRELVDYQRDLFDMVSGTQRELYQNLPPASELYFQELSHLDEYVEQNARGHDLLHEYIYHLIKTDQLPANKVSTVLNLNRALFNSNSALLTALTLMVHYQQEQELTADTSLDLNRQHIAGRTV